MKKELSTERDAITNIENVMRQMPQIEIPVKHYFANGFYAREMTMPAGCTLTGKIHKSEHLCILSKGSVEVASEERTQHMDAPFTYVSQPGAKRVIYAYEETVWTTVHMSEETNIEQLEEDLIAESYTQLAINSEVRQWLGYQ